MLQRRVINQGERDTYKVRRKVKSEKDRRLMQDVDLLRVGLQSTRQAYRQGFGGIALDGRVACSDWRFEIEDIRKDLPMLLWYGGKDTFVPPNHGEEIFKREEITRAHEVLYTQNEEPKARDKAQDCSLLKCFLTVLVSSTWLPSPI